jgi:hypothetical protein
LIFENYKVKPTKEKPLGIEPNFQWKNRRIKNLFNAIQRYWYAGWIVHIEWFYEYADLKNEQLGREGQKYLNM